MWPYSESWCWCWYWPRCDPATPEPWTQLLIFPEGTTSNRQVNSCKTNPPIESVDKKPLILMPNCPCSCSMSIAHAPIENVDKKPLKMHSYRPSWASALSYMPLIQALIKTSHTCLSYKPLTQASLTSLSYRPSSLIQASHTSLSYKPLTHAPHTGPYEL